MVHQVRPVTSDTAPLPPLTTTGPNAAQPQQTHYMNLSSNPYANEHRAADKRKLFAVSIFLLIYIGATCVLLWRILRPEAPQIRVETLTLTNFTTSSNSLVSCNWDATLIAHNPKLELLMSFHGVEAAVIYKSETIAETNVTRNFQKQKNETIVRESFCLKSAYVNDEIIRDWACGRIDFDLMMVAKFKFYNDVWRFKRIVKIYCRDLTVVISFNGTAGSLTDGPKNCRVRM
ncbi:NDR1/HIN1-like protein 3 [Rutidosis leptorrhynchoides]|uniref:NDR1/HIN1-like protein 3 n=1 Tax=Rutidosis leptorrhynchoides TaxID=125765 RepID=UPI003A99380C